MRSEKVYRSAISGVFAFEKLDTSRISPPPFISLTICQQSGHLALLIRLMNFWLRALELSWWCFEWSRIFQYTKKPFLRLRHPHIFSLESYHWTRDRLIWFIRLFDLFISSQWSHDWNRFCKEEPSVKNHSVKLWAEMDCKHKIKYQNLPGLIFDIWCFSLIYSDLKKIVK